jgi:hypothetical protein
MAFIQKKWAEHWPQGEYPFLFQTIVPKGTTNFTP